VSLPLRKFALLRPLREIALIRLLSSGAVAPPEKRGELKSAKITWFSLLISLVGTKSNAACLRMSRLALRQKMSRLALSSGAVEPPVKRGELKSAKMTWLASLKPDVGPRNAARLRMSRLALSSGAVDPPEKRGEFL